jgi:endonuclease/exonuclease/phosphatase family metal-dependent hydrolase
MNIVSYNIQFGRGLDYRVDLKRICQSIDQADIICLQEVDVGWQRSGGVDQVKAISEILPHYYVVFGSSFDVDDSVKNADGTITNRRRQHGDMILSRWPIVSSRTFNLPKTHHDDKFNMQMSFVEAVIQTETRAIRVYNFHAGYLKVEERLAQVKHLARVYGKSPEQFGAWSGKGDIDGDDWSNSLINKEAKPSMPSSAIVCGDFNCTIGSDEYTYLLNHTDLVDCWQVADVANINQSTLKNEMTGDIQIAGKIDHIFVSADLAGDIHQVEIDTKADGSDHCPVRSWLKLNLSASETI